MRFETYPSYRKVNIPWLKKVPFEWKTKRIKFSTYVKGRVGWHGLNSSEFLYDGEFYLVTGTEFTDKNINWEKCYRISEERYFEDSYIHLKENDLLITKDGTIGKLAIVKNKPEYATLNSGVFVTRPLKYEYDTAFMYYVLSSRIFDEFINYHKTGTTINHLYQETYENFEYCFPESIEEQQSIAQFLDYKTEQIDKLIEKKEKLLKLLEEKRIALITNAVTGHCHSEPDLSGEESPTPSLPQMKNSGVAWLGNIPQHWSFAKTMYLGKIITGGTPSKNNHEYWEDGDINWLNSGEINKKIIYEVTKKITAEGKENSNASAIPPKSVLIALNGQGKTKGSVAVLEVESTCSQSLAAIVPNKKINYKYLYFFLESKYKEIRGLVGEARDGLNLDHVKSFVIPIPSISEQKSIIEFIEIELVKISKLSEQVNKAIEKLKEYRTSLITSAVTGKIDLRNWHLTLPLPLGESRGEGWR